MKKIISSLILIFMLSGCYNYNELNDYAIATGMAIDYEHDKFIVSLLISNGAKTAAQSEPEVQNVVYSGEGKSISEAIKNVGLISPKQLYIGHLSVVVISEDSAKLGLYKSLSFFLNDPQSNKDFYIVLSKGTDAKNILKTTTPLTDFPSQYVVENIKSSNKLQGSVSPIDFNKLMNQLINKGTNPVINGFIIEGDINKGKSTENLESTSLDSYIKISNLGYFKKDKFIGWATKDESRGINIINNNATEIYLNIPCKNGNIIVSTDELSNTIKIKKNSDTTINIEGDATFQELTCNINLENTKVIDNIQKEINKEITQYAYKAIKLGKNKKTDLFGIGKKYYQDYPNQYKKINDWDDYFADIKVNVKSNIVLKNLASSQQSIERIANEKDY